METWSLLEARKGSVSPASVGSESLSPARVSHADAAAVSASPGLAWLDPAFGAAAVLEDDGAAPDEANDETVTDPRRDAGSTPPPFLRATLVHAVAARALRRTAEDRFVVCEAVVDDAEAIVELTRHVNMEGATSFVWPLEELRSRIASRRPLVVVAFDSDLLDGEESWMHPQCVGVAGIDIHGMEKPFPVMSIGSRFSQTPAGETFSIPSDFCMCRGLLVDESYQGCGLGSLLHKTRLALLQQIAPATPSVVLSARGSSFAEAKVTLGPALAVQHSLTPEFAKDELFEFTFHTSQGVVHLAHGKEKDGWKFVGVDVSDGGPVWCTTLQMAELTRSYSHLGTTHRLASFVRISQKRSSKLATG